MKQRSDYTFKYNKEQGRHGWLRLTPAYSIKLVKEILNLDGLFAEKNHQISILDPFCGTATTGIVAAEHGFNCSLYDINPFLVWFGTIKSSNFDTNVLNEMMKITIDGLKEVTLDKSDVWVPPMRNIERWWSSSTLLALGNLRSFLSETWGEPTMEGEQNLIWIAFARLVIDCSAADFNHISVSFKEETQDFGSDIFKNMFMERLRMIVDSAKNELTGHVRIYHNDSRYLEVSETYDLVITSPPYPNRISYIRELRPYMYWLKFLSSGEEAGEIDWKAIGGTWGSATSKLHTWEQITPTLPQRLLDVCNRIENADEKNGRTMALYAKKFFDDMYLHLSNLRNHLNDHASINYILGNSSFYGNYVETDLIIEEMLNGLDYRNIKSQIIRKRNSKSHLYEYNITANWWK